MHAAPLLSWPAPSLCVTPSPRHGNHSNARANGHFADLVGDFGLVLFNFGTPGAIQVFQN
jgi:hypothetical protein